jgi:hypothetical protein
MKLLIQSAMIFFGTLMTAALVALGEPSGAGLAVVPHDSRHATQASGQVVAATQAAPAPRR